MHSPRRLLLVSVAVAFVAAALLGVGSSPGAVPPLPEDACPPQAATLHAVECAGIVPVPSLDPAATDAAWRKLARGHQVLAGAAVAGACRPLRAVFYTATDWRRLATKLAA